MRVTATVTHEPPFYVAQCLDVDVASQGESVDEAVANLREALELYFEDMPLPEGINPPIVVQVDLSA